LIVRISKVFSVNPADETLLSQWYRMIRQGETIRNASDQRTCPTYNGDITAGLLQLLDREATGLFNLCQPKSYTRAELFSEFLSVLGIRYANVEEWETFRFGFLDERPANTSLSPAKFLRFTGYEFTPMKDVLQRFQQNLP
jgi:dTDP-4-dehydrorhamnose reductase